MNLKNNIAALTAALSIMLAVAGCQSQPAPTAAPQAAVQPTLLNTHLDKALRNQNSLVERAEKLQPDKRLPMPMAHSAGASAVAALDRQEQAVAKPTPADDKRSLAIWFSGNAIAETDPCG